VYEEREERRQIGGSRQEVEIEFDGRVQNLKF